MPYCSSSSNLCLHNKDKQEQIEVQALQFNVHLNIDALPGFEDTTHWDDGLTDSFHNAIRSPTILLENINSLPIIVLTL